MSSENTMTTPSPCAKRSGEMQESASDIAHPGACLGDECCVTNCLGALLFSAVDTPRNETSNSDHNAERCNGRYGEHVSVHPLPLPPAPRTPPAA